MLMNWRRNKDWTLIDEIYIFNKKMPICEKSSSAQ